MLFTAIQNKFLLLRKLRIFAFQSANAFTLFSINFFLLLDLACFQCMLTCNAFLVIELQPTVWKVAEAL